MNRQRLRWMRQVPRVLQVLQWMASDSGQCLVGGAGGANRLAALGAIAFIHGMSGMEPRLIRSATRAGIVSYPSTMPRSSDAPLGVVEQ